MRWIALAVVVGCGHSSPAGGDATSGDDAAGDASSDAGDTDAIPACPSGQWCTETAPIASTLLHGVFAVNAGDVFAVGDGGTIIRRRGNAWTQMTSGVTANLRGVWGSASDDVWAVGAGATILHFDGTSWAPQASVAGLSGADLSAVWGSSDADVWVAGAQRVGHYVKPGWTGSTLIGDHNALSGTGPTDVWVAGENEKPQHFDGSWHVMDPGSGSGTVFYTVWSVSPTDIWVSTPNPNKETVEYGGATWTPHDTNAAFFQGMWGTQSSLWGAGGTAVGHYDGATWTTDRPAGDTAAMFAITGAGGNLWIVGDASLILHRD
jgi:hypothetical protein